MTKITTHVLDISLGKPAANVKIALEATLQGQSKIIAEGITNAEGRVAPSLYEGASLESGTYRLLFFVGSYFASTARTTIYPVIAVNVVLDDPHQHFHLPLLVSPGGYTTYRGT